ncbi:MAG: alcohol dehydrogenase catalytic domain-containing protein [Elusimicrobia bacterium]|nr:alcohol dehydrogenase catalytic domain-containing protein [Elusimicrobiota bacterium]
MKVAVYHNNKDIRVEERPIPKIGPGELLFKVMASGICGSDVMEWYRIKKAPCVLGHEVAGEIVEIGEGVTKFKKGDRVIVTHHVPCNACRWCQRGFHTLCDTLRSTNFDPGGFSEYIRIPKINVERGTLAIPQGMTYEEASFAEPLGCVCRGFRMAGFKPKSENGPLTLPSPPRGEGLGSVLVLGSGISGILIIALAKHLGASRVIATDVNAWRLETAKKFGADEILHAKDATPANLAAINKGRLAEFVVICTGITDVFSQALKCADRGGTVLYFAPAQPGQEISFPLFDFWHNGTTLTSTYGAALEDLASALDIIHKKRISVAEMITHRLPLDQTAKGFHLVAEAKESLKVIIQPHT